MATASRGGGGGSIYSGGPSTLRVEAEELGIGAGEHPCKVLSNGWRGETPEDDGTEHDEGKGGATLRVGADGVGTVALQLREGATLVLACEIA